MSLLTGIASGGIFTYIEIAIVVAIAAGIGYLYFDNKVLKANLQTAVDNQQKLTDTITADQLQIKDTLSAVKQQQTITQDLSTKNSALDANLNKLQGAMTVVVAGQKVDIKTVAKTQPTVIEQKINQGTKNALRCDELATGATLVAEDATNPLCPELVKTVVVPNVKK